MKAIGIVTSAIIVIFYGAAMDGWALTKLWAWFVVPVFSLPALNIPQAIGIALLVGYLTTSISKTEKEDEFGLLLAKAIAIATFKPLLALGCGAVVRAFL